jgi:hypothetical protein
MTMHEGNGEKRAYKRIETDGNCWAQVDTSDRLSVRNISLYGTCLIVPQPMDKDSAHELTVGTGEQDKISLSGSVMWSFPLGAEVSGDGDVSYYETGFKFLDMDESQKSSLEAFIAGLD